jgi:hypothetical protein
MPVGLADVLLEAVADRAWSDDVEIVSRRKVGRDGTDEPSEVLEAVGLAGILRCDAAVTDDRVVPDVAGRPMVGGHVRSQTLDLYLTVAQVGNDRFSGVDPDQGAIGRHDRAHAGRSAWWAARSA